MMKWFEKDLIDHMEIVIAVNVIILILCVFLQISDLGLPFTTNGEVKTHLNSKKKLIKVYLSLGYHKNIEIEQNGTL